MGVSVLPGSLTSPPSPGPSEALSRLRWAGASQWRGVAVTEQAGGRGCGQVRSLHAGTPSAHGARTHRPLEAHGPQTGVSCPAEVHAAQVGASAEKDG